MYVLLLTDKSTEHHGAYAIDRCIRLTLKNDNDNSGTPCDVCGHFQRIPEGMAYLGATMRSPRIRPRFICYSPERPQEIVERVRLQMRRNNPSDLKLRGTVDDLVLRFPSHTNEAWTPQIQIRLEEQASGGTLIRGVIGPATRIWKVFLGTLTAFTTLGVMGLFVGFLQWTMNTPPWGLYLALVGLAAGLFLYFIADAAKSRARDKADLLRAFMDSALGRSCFLPASQLRAHQIAGNLA